MEPILDATKLQKELADTKALVSALRRSNELLRDQLAFYIKYGTLSRPLDTFPNR